MKLFKVLEKIIGSQIIHHSPVSGGDINEAYKLETATECFFLKTNTESFALSMFASEMEGLETIAESKIINTPNCIGFGEEEGIAYLLMDFVESGTPNNTSWQTFGNNLAQLHKSTAEQFGFQNDNFIGSLPQSNKSHDNWISFYKEERINPQLDLAYRRNRLSNSSFAQVEDLFEKAKNVFPEEKPAFIHGDLWNGNFLFNNKGEPVLIDPSVSYSHREMDLAMTLLFGGFPPDFYQAYQESFPISPGFEERKELYQLYYLLVHVNLFGGSYVQSVQRILDKFS